MDTITVLHRDAPGAPARIACTVVEAAAQGYENIQTTYEPPTGLYVITGDAPAGQ